MKNLFVILVFSFLQVSGQAIFKTNFSIKNTPVQIKELGKSAANIYYNVKFSTDSKSTNKREAICLLQVDGSISKFFDYKQLKYDSILQKYNDKDFLGAREAEELLKFRVIWSNVILKIYDTLIVQDRFKSLYQYNEIKPHFNWKLEEGTKKILNYDCKKATLDYAGRTYTAWYSMDIPINNGPYKFEGLPGLILEIYDSKNEFIFEAVGINSYSLPIYMRNDDRIFVVSKEKFKTIQISYHENPAFFYGNAYNADGSVMTNKSTRFKYNLLELE